MSYQYYTYFKKLSLIINLCKIKYNAQLQNKQAWITRVISGSNMFPN